MHFFDTIKPTVYARIEKAKPLDFIQIFKKDHPAVIAEIKYASPSLGKLYHGNLTAIEIASLYMQTGASAISVVTEPHFFKGDLATVWKIKQHNPDIPILVKDFILSEEQIIQAKAFGADAVLLIAGFVDKATLKQLYDKACALQITPVVEIHDEAELAIALEIGTKIIGINNRNLKTLEIDLNTSKQLLPLIPKHIKIISESGFENVTAMKEMTKLGCDGFLIGSSLMQSNDIEGKLKDLLRVRYES